MARLKGIGAFLVWLLVLFAALRLVHLGVPIFYPKVLAGPFSLDDIGQVREYTGFSPRMPFYRPEALGPQPIHITVTRRPHPQVVIFWQGDRFLYLAERRGGRAPETSMRASPLPGHPEAQWWRDGRTYKVVAKDGDLWIELRTDLSFTDVQRLIDSLRPYEELL